MAANLDPNNNVDSSGNPISAPSVGVGGAPAASGAPTSAGAPAGSPSPQSGNIASSGGIQQSFLNPSAPAPQANNSGNFTNVQAYLNANQGGGQNIAGAINNNAQNQAGNANNTVNNAQGMIGGQIAQENANIAQASGDVSQIASGNAANLFGGYNATNNGFNNASQFANFQQLQNGTTNAAALTGAASQALQPAQADVNNLNTYANQANSETGRFGLLQQTLGNAGYNQGEQGIDNLLLSSSPGNVLGNLQSNLNTAATGASNNLANAQQQFSTNIGALTPAAQAAQSQIAAAIGTTGAAGTGAAGTAYTPNAAGTYGSGALGALQTSLVGQLGTQQGTANTDYANLISALNNGGINSAQLGDISQALGGNLTANSQLYGGMTGASLDPAFAAQQYNINQVATAPQYTQYQALQALAGTPGATNQIAGLTGPVAAPTNDINVNSNMFGTTYQNNQNAYNTATQPFQNLSNQLGLQVADQNQLMNSETAQQGIDNTAVNNASMGALNGAAGQSAYSNALQAQAANNNQLLANTNVWNLEQTQQGLANTQLAAAQKAAGATGSLASLLNPGALQSLGAMGGGQGATEPLTQAQVQQQVTQLLGAGAGQYVAPSGGGGGMFGNIQNLIQNSDKDALIANAGAAVI